MAKERISMRHLREILRLRKQFGLSPRRIGISCGIGRTTVQEYLKRFEKSGLPWPLPSDLSDDELIKKVFPAKNKEAIKPLPDFKDLAIEMAKPNMNFMVLWEEYKQDNPAGYQYSQFCRLFSEYIDARKYSMRQIHKAGEKVFVDFGEGLSYTDMISGQEVKTRAFVFVWGASLRMFACCTPDEKIHSWISAHTSAVEYFGCCSKTIVPDNLRSGVSKACRYEPVLNRSYAAWAEYYNTAIIPARVRKPKDKSLAEIGVKIVKRWIFVRLRNRQFFSLAEINQAILELLETLDNKVIKSRGKSRKQLFLELDKPNALPLPGQPYQFAEWKKAKAGIDYHVLYDNHSYSIPYTYAKQELEIKASSRVIEIYRKDVRICMHKRSYVKNGFTTDKEHMLKSHRAYLEWTPERIMQWAEKYGPSVKAVVKIIIERKYFPEQAYRSCLGIISLEKKYSASRLDSACKRALEHRSCSYTSVRSILEHNLDQIEDKPAASKKIHHENIRGSEYYEPSMN